MRALHPKERAVKKRKALRRSDPGAGHLDKMLDEALGETFPASDPVAITIETPSTNTTTTHRPIRPPLRRTGGSAHSDSPERLYPTEAGLPHLPSPPKAS
jgi:hypothetical protein